MAQRCESVGDTVEFSRADSVTPSASPASAHSSEVRSPFLTNASRDDPVAVPCSSTHAAVTNGSNGHQEPRRPSDGDASNTSSVSSNNAKRRVNSMERLSVSRHPSATSGASSIVGGMLSPKKLSTTMGVTMLDLTSPSGSNVSGRVVSPIPIAPASHSSNVGGTAPGVASRNLAVNVEQLLPNQATSSLRTPNASGHTFGKDYNASSFSWRQVRGSSSTRSGAPHVVASNAPPPVPTVHRSVQRSVYGLLSEYSASLPSSTGLQRALHPHLTMMLMDQDVVTSLDLPSMNDSCNPAGKSIFTSPRHEGYKRLRQRIELDSRRDFNDFSTDQLLDYSCRAHAFLVVLAEVLATPQPQASQPINGGHGHSDVVDSFASHMASFAAASQTVQVASMRSRNAQLGQSKSMTMSTVSRSTGATHQSSKTSNSDGSSGSGGGTHVVVVPEEPVEPSRAHSFFLDNNTLAFLQGEMGTSNGVNSVASQPLEPVHETGVANRSKDELGVKMLNNYILMDTLGQGACGKVKLGYDIDKGQSVAIKVVRRGRGGHFTRSNSQAKIEALQREIAVMKKLRHKNIVSLYEVIDDPEAEKLYLVMQFVDEGPIAKMNSDGSCPTRPAAEVAMYARQVCAGLEYLHSHGVVHRDIKPENILVSSTKQAFLADFGVSEVFGAQEAREVRGHKGTPMFMAPEMWHHGASNLAESSSHHEINDDEGALEGFALDVWALGVTFYMLLVGKPPFANLEQTMSRAELPPLTFPEAANVPAEWMSILRRMLDPKPYKRPQASVIRAHIKKLEKTLNPPPAIPAKHSSRGKGGMVVHVDDVATAFTPRYATSGPRPSVGFTSPTVSPANASRRSVAVGRGTFLHVPTARAASMGSNGFTPVVQSLTAPNLSSPTGSAEPPPDDSRGSISPNPMTHTVFVEREGGPPRVRFEDEYIPPPALSPAPPATQRPDTASPKLLKQAVPSCQEEVPEARRDGDTPDGTTTLGNSDGTFRDGSILQSTSTAGDLRVITFTNSRGEYQPAIVVHDADMFE